MTSPQTKNNPTNQTKRLSVQVTLTGLSFLIASREGEVLFFSEVHFETSHTPEELLYQLTDQFAKQPELNESFDGVNLIYTTHNYSLVPQSLFDESKASEYLKFNTKILGNDFISFDEIDAQQAVVVYVPFVNINNFMFEKFGSFSYFHSSTLLIQNLLNAEKHSETSKVYLHILEEQFECIISEQGQLQLCNSYSFKTPEDFIYYVLFCFEQLDLNPDSVETVVCGNITLESELYEILYTYVRNVSFLDWNRRQLAQEASHQHVLLKSVL